jgi:predicted alpha/beta superfamily hydrolase
MPLHLIGIRGLVSGLALLFVASSTSVCEAQLDDRGDDVTIGRRLVLHSQILAEDRTVLVHLPSGYQMERTRYPVLYLLDGEYHFVHGVGITDFLAMRSGSSIAGQAPGMIVVGIPNMDRERDLTPAIARRIDPGSYEPVGPSARFMRFLSEELVPHIDRSYRTQPHRVLAGHSLAGSFVLHDMLADPGTFRSYIAITPYVREDSPIAASTMGGVLRSGKDAEVSLFIAMANEDPTWVGEVEAIAETLRVDAPEGLEWHFKRLQGGGDGAEVHLALYEGLKTLYRDWPLPGKALKDGLDTIEGHYAGLGRRYGYEVIPPELMLNWLGYMQLEQGALEEAERVFRRNVELYPGSWNVHDSLGEALYRAGRFDEAEASYRRSLEINPNNDNGARFLKLIQHDRLTGGDAPEAKPSEGAPRANGGGV